MSRDPGPTDCCTYECNQGRNCPVRIARLTTAEGSKQVDTESLFDWVDGLLLVTRCSMILIVAVLAVMSVFYYFWG